MSSGDLRIDRFLFRELRIPFKTTFRHAAAERAETESVWIEAIAADGRVGNGESCPRPYVTGETLATARAFTVQHEAALRETVHSVDTLRAWIAAHETDIDANPAAWCALELAILDLLGKHHDTPVETLLSVQPLADGTFQYTAVLGDASSGAFHAMAERYRLAGFRDFKVKLSRDVERDRDKMAVFGTWPADSIRVRADANNLWPNADDAVAALRRLDYPFFAIEEPIGKDRHAELPRISQALNCAIILDESFLRREQLLLLGEPSSQWLINVRVSKMGGMIRSLEVVEAARARGIGVIVGAQVGETSLLTRAALTVARAAGNLLVAQEGAFGTFLLERDVCDPPLMFGAGGVLDISAHPMLDKPGLGLPSSGVSARA
ncbi:MAG: mandelate racemase/muconate lactonizing enzyme family protein [Vicinamibacterales bacterium]